MAFLRTPELGDMVTDYGNAGRRGVVTATTVGIGHEPRYRVKWQDGFERWYLGKHLTPTVSQTEFVLGAGR